MEIEEFIDAYPSGVARLGHETREFIKKAVPDASETLHIGWRVISYGHEKKFCAIAPHGKWVNLQFHHGANLEDPNGLLEGSGKSMRHVRIESGKDLDKKLKDLIEAAAEMAR